MSKPVFFYATGTAFMVEIMGFKVFPIGGAEGAMTATAPDGRRVYWDGFISSDPFWRLLDQRKWDARKIDYGAATLGLQASVNNGVDLVKDQWLALPPGTPVMLGGYSQGAAVMSYIYDQLRGGALSARQADFKGAVLFGNPRRQTDFVAPGVSYSGGWDDPGATTGAGGCFPDRLVNCEYGKWREYNNFREIIGSTGNTALGQAWRTLVGWFIGQTDPISSLVGILSNPVIEAFQAAMAIGAGGHVQYPILPPTSSASTSFAPGTKTAFEMALDFISEVYDGLNRPALLPSTDPLYSRPWSTLMPVPAA